jgi:hypothetical protein
MLRWTSASRAVPVGQPFPFQKTRDKIPALDDNSSGFSNCRFAQGELHPTRQNGGRIFGTGEGVSNKAVIAAYIPTSRRKDMARLCLAPRFFELLAKASEPDRFVVG